MKKSILSYLCLIISIFSFSCKEPYKMQYTPGVTVDEEAFNEHKTLWENSGIKNYSYTYTLNMYPPYKVIADVTVINGEVSYVLKECNQYKEEEISEVEKEYFENMLEGKDNLLIENVYETIQLNIERVKERYAKNSDCYYGNFIFDFIDEAPFISYYKSESCMMKPLLGGNYGYIEIKIENFKEN